MSSLNWQFEISWKLCSFNLFYTDCFLKTIFPGRGSYRSLCFSCANNFDGPVHHTACLLMTWLLGIKMAWFWYTIRPLLNLSHVSVRYKVDYWFSLWLNVKCDLLKKSMFLCNKWIHPSISKFKSSKWYNFVFFFMISVVGYKNILMRLI